MNESQKYGSIGIILSVIAIILTVILEWNTNLLLTVLVLGVTAIAFAYLSFYIKQIKENSEKINQLEKRFETEKRLIKIEDFIGLMKLRKFYRQKNE